MKLIFNADDFGYSKGVNYGIMEAYQNGVVRSATMMAGMIGFDHAVQLAKENPGLKIGVHLTLTTGKSVGGIYKTLTDEDGYFLSQKEIENRANEGKLDLSEVEEEYEVQIKKITTAGICVDHFDGHHHTQNLSGVSDIFLKLAKRHRVSVRFPDKERLCGDYSGIKTTDSFTQSFYGEDVTVKKLMQCINGCKGESLEIMCHPAYLDYELYRGSSYNIRRFYELDVLTGNEIKRYIKENSYILCSFSDLE
ncbi:MAG: chitin disaccharide deacetylase [Lachnoclostridium sp.]|jgi:predicted glycoside hydrolase/deacetylase ChbG (UPF0249 family)|nr:chitin disaccharide deacetylase [Lachnoclostridium sp.]